MFTEQMCRNVRLSLTPRVLTRGSGCNTVTVGQDSGSPSVRTLDNSGPPYLALITVEHLVVNGYIVVITVLPSKHWHCILCFDNTSSL